MYKCELYIISTKNNTIVTLRNLENVVFCKSTGNLKFKGTKKSTPFAAQKLGEFVLNEIKKKNIEEINIKIKGFGPGREAILRVFSSESINIKEISDITPYPHNGCRPKKKRRV
ncbi:30S ribosomal protein S11 [Candidatus Vidania fulgoroideae]|nr:30S ribosomal protein S11 [Candidatus Vidania fulgoroideae]